MQDVDNLIILTSPNLGTFSLERDDTMITTLEEDLAILLLL